MMSDHDDDDEEQSEDAEEERECWQRDQDQLIEQLEKDDLRLLHFLISEDNQPLDIEEVEERVRNIGQALEHATHVRHVELWFGGYYHDVLLERDDGAPDGLQVGVVQPVSLPNHGSIEAHAGFREFVRTSKTIRTFHFGNLCYESPGFVGFTQSYIRAAQENSNIITFRWEEFNELLVPALCELLRTTKSIQFLEIHGDDEGDMTLNNQAVVELCMAFADNESLKSVTFDGISFDHDVPVESLVRGMAQNETVTELSFRNCGTVALASASSFLNVFHRIEKLSTCVLTPFMEYFSLSIGRLESRPSNIQELHFFGEAAGPAPKMKGFIASQPNLKRLNCAFSTKPSNRDSLRIMKAINEGIEAQTSSALKSLFLDNFVIPKQVMDKMDNIVRSLEEMEFHFHFAAKLPSRAKKWISDPKCTLKVLRLNLYRLNEKNVRDLFRVLGQNKSIETLLVKNLDVSVTVLKPILQDCLYRMTQLSKLTTTSASMVRAFCEAKNNNVTELEIEGEQLSRNGILEALVDLLPQHDCKLKRLTVSNLTDEEEEHVDNYEENPNVERQIKLVDVLSRNRSLEYLRLNGLEPSIPLFNLAVVLPSLGTLKELLISVSQLWETDPTTLFGLETALLRGLEHNKSLTRFDCDLEDAGYTFQRDVIFLCLRNKVRSVALDMGVEIPREILQHAADFLL